MEGQDLTLETLAKQIDALSQKSAAQEQTIADQAATITKLQGKVLEEAAEEKKIETPKEAVELGGKEYKFTVPQFRLPGSDKVYLSEEVATDNALLKSIVEIDGQGILRELV